MNQKTTMQRVLPVFIQYSRVVILLIIFAFFSITTDTFWSIDNWGNFTNILFQQLPFLMLMTISMSISILLNGIDLSIGSSVAMISCLAALVLSWTYNPWLGIASAVLMGLIIGLINGYLIAYVGVSPFVATYSMQWILRGFAMVLLAGQSLSDFGPDFRPLFQANSYTYFVIAIVILLVTMFIFGKTVFGQHVYAVGKNPAAAALMGVNCRRVILISYAISGVIIGVVAIMYNANLGMAEPVTGSDFAIKAIAATLIGGTAMGGGKGKIFNAFVGAMILLCVTNGMVQIGVPSTWQDFVTGLVIVLAMFIEMGLTAVERKAQADARKAQKALESAAQ